MVVPRRSSKDPRKIAGLPPTGCEEGEDRHLDGTAASQEARGASLIRGHHRRERHDMRRSKVQHQFQTFPALPSNQDLGYIFQRRGSFPARRMEPPRQEIAFTMLAGNESRKDTQRQAFSALRAFCLPPRSARDV